MRLIDADAFKEYICNAYERVKHMYPDGGEWARQITEDFCKDIDEQPTAETEPEWIPCSERLPKDKQEILFSTKTGRVHSGRYHDDNSVNQWYSHKDRARAWNNVVIAWMPLPECYRGDENVK